jgi:hypothetical protein
LRVVLGANEYPNHPSYLRPAADAFADESTDWVSVAYLRSSRVPLYVAHGPNFRPETVNVLRCPRLPAPDA